MRTPTAARERRAEGPELWLLGLRAGLGELQPPRRSLRRAQPPNGLKWRLRQLHGAAGAGGTCFARSSGFLREEQGSVLSFTDTQPTGR